MTEWFGYYSVETLGTRLRSPQSDFSQFSLSPSDADRDAEIKDMTNGGLELRELLTENTAPSDFEDEEFELNVYGKR